MQLYDEEWKEYRQGELKEPEEVSEAKEPREELKVNDGEKIPSLPYCRSGLYNSLWKDERKRQERNPAEKLCYKKRSQLMATQADKNLLSSHRNDDLEFMKYKSAVKEEYVKDYPIDATQEDLTNVYN